MHHPHADIKQADLSDINTTEQTTDMMHFFNPCVSLERVFQLIPQLQTWHAGLFDVSLLTIS